MVLAAQDYGASGVGVELDAKLIDISRRVAQDAQVENRVRFVQGDLFKADISEATVVTLYLSYRSQSRPRTQAQTRAAPGNSDRVASVFDWHLGTRPPRPRR